MSAITFVDSIPLWALYILSALGVLLSIELGWRLGDYRRYRTEEESKAPISAPVGAILGLLAFLLAFTFGMAGTRFDNRKQIVLQEANAIGTTYLRTDFLTEQQRNEARSLLRKYTALRAGGAAVFMSPEGMAQSASIQDQLWAIAVSAEATSDTVSSGLFSESLNEMIDLDAIRVTANRNRIPDSIWMMLGVVTIFSMVALGYEFGLTGVRSWPLMILLTIVFTTVIMLIADLDRPQAGLIHVSQQALFDLLNKIGTPVP
jgi:hypothetical protein